MAERLQQTDFPLLATCVQLRAGGHLPQTQEYRDALVQAGADKDPRLVGDITTGILKATGDIQLLEEMTNPKRRIFWKIKILEIGPSERIQRFLQWNQWTDPHGIALLDSNKNTLLTQRQVNEAFIKDERNLADYREQTNAQGIGYDLVVNYYKQIAGLSQK